MYISKCSNDKGTEISTLWQAGKSLGEIVHILKIRLTYKNAATGENIPADDMKRCIINDLIEHDSI